MQASGAPAKIPLPFANSGQKNTIPIPSQVPTSPGLASFTTGFPPLCLTPIDAGGIAPFGQDMNGILFAVSAVAQWFCAGATFTYDATFSSQIGGYPAGCRVASASNSAIIWYNTTDNNTSNPDSGGAGWIRASGIGAPVVLTMAGTHVVYASFANYLAIVTGSGGNGSGCQANGPGTPISGAGGGAGGTAIGLITGYSQGASISYTIGSAGGASASSVGGMTANNGAAGAFYSGSSTNSAGGRGGTASGGAFNIGGGDGSDGQCGGGTGYAQSLLFAGNGGASFWGGGGRAGALSVSGGLQTGGGMTAQAFGAGGGGTYDGLATNFAAIGGGGGAGIIVLFPLGATVT